MRELHRSLAKQALGEEGGKALDGEGLGVGQRLVWVKKRKSYGGHTLRSRE